MLCFCFLLCNWPVPVLGIYETPSDSECGHLSGAMFRPSYLESATVTQAHLSMVSIALKT